MVEFKGFPSVVPIQKKFETLMNIDKRQFNEIWDKSFLMLGKTRIDIFKLDDILHERFGEYEIEGKSMSDIIIEKYRKEANELVEQLI
jgi:hypothetical protein